VSELNLCGVLVLARVNKAATVRARAAAMPGVEVHALTGNGRLVLTVEDSPGQPGIDTISAINAIEGVLSASVVYQHTYIEESHQEPRP